MLTPEEYRIEAEACLKLASETQQVYARTALLEMAADYMALAENRQRKSQKRSARVPKCLRRDQNPHLKGLSPLARPNPNRWIVFCCDGSGRC
jgi:hypothetical protein